jgi:hypothetical protein
MGSRRPPGSYSRSVVPRHLFTSQDAADRLQCSRRHVTNLLRRFNIERGIIRRSVKLPNGDIVWRRVMALSPSSLEALILQHACYLAGRTVGRQR